MSIQTFSKNEVIFREGEYQKWMYSVEKGSVEIYANYGAESQTLLSTLDAGKYFGEIGLTDYVPRTAAAVAARGRNPAQEVSPGEAGGFVCAGKALGNQSNGEFTGFR